MQRGLTRQQVGKALDSILDVITDQMAEGGAVTIAGFGRFEAKVPLFWADDPNS